MAVTNALGTELLAQIEAVDPRTRTRQVAALVVAEDRWLRSPHTPEPVEQRHSLDETLAQALVLFGWSIPHDILRRAPKLRWIQSMSAGVDQLLDTGVEASPILVSDASGIHQVPIGEFVMGQMLALAKGFPRYWAQQAQRRWRRHPVPGELYERTVAIVGLGAIGGGVAHLAKAFGMRVLATRRSARERQTGVGDVDVLYPPQELGEIIAQADFLVLAVPLTPETRGLIGEPELRRLKPTAYLINVSRGAVVEEVALVRALKEGWFAGAALDVFPEEPLPKDHELWGLPNVIITPHVAGDSERYNVRVTDLFCQNLRRYLAGQPLLNQVDFTKGY
ncbi:MAG: D-2-hydroxyacid dehydrogenase [Chloroflexi bacterium]|nr:D-2-hydroxyacid dehydrogenase [Chloroflexota bacterium]